MELVNDPAIIGLDILAFPVSVIRAAGVGEPGLTMAEL